MSRNPLVLQQWLEQLYQWHPAWAPAMGAAIFGFMALWGLEAWYLNRVHDGSLDASSGWNWPKAGSERSDKTLRKFSCQFSCQLRSRIVSSVP
jgi:hypothetical protein